ncbi:hypothetical protein PR202_gb05188 [Eleusine coracana subsp. coracana]|uniref:Dynamin-type G domain-containing protein n=1 Tax=Eleusine coracana subsp. coracana TaxID=191504 RepID=A0AAV5E4S1_ELECO|nr:hypothetical protein PR202_gb05188 [Eleusine coracana subsp. coracana]
MENLISLVNKLQRACTALGDHGEGSTLPTLWDSLPVIAVVGGQFPHVLAIQNLELNYTNVGFDMSTSILIRDVWQSSGKSSVLESVVGKDFLPRGSGIVTRRPLVLQLHRIDGQGEYAEFMHLKDKRFTDFGNFSSHLLICCFVVNLTLVDLPGLTKVAVDGQPDSIVLDIENMVRSFIEKPNCIILAISAANQDLATSDAIKISREVDPKGERTFGVLTKIDLMDKGTDAVDILEGRSYRLPYPWIGVVNRSQQDINKNVDMIAARLREREYFASTPQYKHLTDRMGSEHLAKMLSKHLENVIKSRIPGLQSLITKTTAELETELHRLGKPIAADAGGKLYTIMEICRMFDGIYKEHLDGAYVSNRELSVPHVFYNVHSILKELVHKSIKETHELKQFPTLRVEVSNAAFKSLDRMRDESKKNTLKLVDMECDYLTVDFFRKLPQDVEKGGNATYSIFDRYTDSYLKRIGTNVLAYVDMLFPVQTKQLSKLLDEDPEVMERRANLAKRLELYRSAQAEIDAVEWAK